MKSHPKEEELEVITPTTDKPSLQQLQEPLLVGDEKKEASKEVCCTPWTNIDFLNRQKYQELFTSMILKQTDNSNSLIMGYTQQNIHYYFLFQRICGNNFIELQIATSY